MLRVFGFSILMLFAVAITLPIAESQAGRTKSSSASWRKRSKRMTRRQRIAYIAGVAPRSVGNAYSHVFVLWKNQKPQSQLLLPKL